METGSGIALSTVILSIAGIIIAYINNNNKYVRQEEYRLMCEVLNKEIKEIKKVITDLSSQIGTINVNIGQLLVRKQKEQ